MVAPADLDERLLAYAFEKALDLDSDSRMALLQDVRATSAATGLALEELLTAHEQRSDLLDEPLAIDASFAEELEGMAADAQAPHADLVGSSIGGMQVLRHIGSGGMGDVYEAQQERPHRRVALKVLSARSGGGGRGRFAIEVEALARLDHPHIARVFGAGAFDGQAWMAFEHIDGAMPLTEYAAKKQLTIRQRVALFLPLCRAIHHAHQKSVLHRDLKPANLLVASAGEPVAKVIDFGLARLFDVDAEAGVERGDLAEAQRTRHGELLGTLRYMSPEQCDGDPARLDVRTDVYGLGVVLYELIAGRLPYDLEGASLLGILDTIRGAAVVDPSKVDGSIDADLAAVILQALEKHPDDRFGSAAELGDDLERWLRREPVEARRPTLTHRARLFARRRTGLFASILGAAAVALAAITMITVLYFDNRSKMQRIERSESLAAERANEVDVARAELASLTTLLGGVDVGLADQVVAGARAAAGRAESADEERRAVERAIGQLQELNVRLEGDDASVRALAEAFYQVGQLIARDWWARPEDAVRSVEALRESASLWRRAVVASPQDEARRKGLARALVAAANACRNAELIAAGRAFADEAVSLARHACSDDPTDSERVHALIQALNARGDLHIDQEPFRQGLIDAEEVLGQVERMRELGQSPRIVERERSWTMLRLGFWRRRVLDDAAAGLAAHREAARIRVAMLEASIAAEDAPSIVQDATTLMHVLAWNEIGDGLRLEDEAGVAQSLARLYGVLRSVEGTAALPRVLGYGTGLAALHMDRLTDERSIDEVRTFLARAWSELDSDAAKAERQAALACFAQAQDVGPRAAEIRAWVQAAGWDSDGEAAAKTEDR